MSSNERESGQLSSPEPERGKLRVLVPLDGSELAEKALPVAEHLCSALAGELHFVRVLPTLVVPYYAGDMYIPADIYQQMETDQENVARSYLAQTAAQARERGVGEPVRIHLQRGDAAYCVLDLVAGLRPALIVMTTHGRTGLARFTLGSVADRVVRGGAAPVLLLRSFASQTQIPDFSHALVPLDGSPLAEVPLFSIVPLLAGSVLRTITLLRVVDPRDGPDGRKAAEDYLDAVSKRLREWLGGTACAINGVVRVGRNPAEHIVGCSRDETCGFILMSTHGEAGVGRLAFGGVTDRVVRDGQLPLLLVHPPRV